MPPGTSSRAGGWLGSGPPTSGAEEKAPDVHRGCSRGFPALSGQRSPAGLVSTLFFSAAGAGTPGPPASRSPSALSRLLSLSLPRFPGCARAVLESRSSRRSPPHPPCPRSAASAAGEGREPGAGQGPSSALTMQPGAPLPPLYLCSSSTPAVQKPRGGRERASFFSLGKGKGEGRLLYGLGVLVGLSDPRSAPSPVHPLDGVSSKGSLEVLKSSSRSCCPALLVLRCPLVPCVRWGHLQSPRVGAGGVGGSGVMLTGWFGCLARTSPAPARSCPAQSQRRGSATSPAGLSRPCCPSCPWLPSFHLSLRGRRVPRWGCASCPRGKFPAAWIWIRSQAWGVTKPSEIPQVRLEGDLQSQQALPSRGFVGPVHPSGTGGSGFAERAFLGAFPALLGALSLVTQGCRECVTSVTKPSFIHTINYLFKSNGY